MRGVVSIRDRGPHASELELRYGFAARPGLPAGALWPGRVADLNIRTQLTQLKRFAERWSRLDDLVLSCEDSIRVQGPAELAYDFLYRAGDWPEHVAHISAARLREEAPGIQHLTLRTPAGDGVHTSESVRICFPHAGRIVHKQTTPSPLLAAHTGEWSLTEDERGRPSPRGRPSCCARRTSPRSWATARAWPTPAGRCGRPSAATAGTCSPWPGSTRTAPCACWCPLPPRLLENASSRPPARRRAPVP